MWLVTNTADTLKLVNMGPGPRQVYTAPVDYDDTALGWEVWLDIDGTDDGQIFMAGPFEQEPDAHNYIRALVRVLSEGWSVGLLGYT